jgi:tRNA A-37 threonylcarbamoyl transferase component Bud32
VHGTAAVSSGGTEEFSIFVKQLRSARLWPSLHVIPESFQENFVNEFPWRIEIDAYDRPMADVLPAGMRMADLYEVVEVDADHATIWMEDVRCDAQRSWDSTTYTTAARLLGELAGRRPLGSPTALGIPANHVPGLALAMYGHGRIRNQSIPAILADETWHLRRVDGPEYTVLRERLRRTTNHLDAILGRLERLPHLFAHGDATPHNLLVPADEPDTFAIIDWGFNSPLAVGFDLGQLLVGLANSDELDAAELKRLEPLVVDAYTEGLRNVGVSVRRDDVREGYALSVAVRSMFTALGLDEGPADGTWTDEHRDNRVVMTEYLVGLCEEYL